MTKTAARRPAPAPVAVPHAPAPPPVAPRAAAASTGAHPADSFAAAKLRPVLLVPILALSAVGRLNHASGVAPECPANGLRGRRARWSASAIHVLRPGGPREVLNRAVRPCGPRLQAPRRVALSARSTGRAKSHLADNRRSAVTDKLTVSLMASALLPNVIGTGLANETLRFLHLPTSNWTNGADTALVSLVVVATWANMGGTVLIYLAALQSIPGELYEAAELDGAGLLQRIRHVTVPQTRFVILMLMLLQIIATMQVFTEPFVITGGGPENATVTVLYLIYKYAFLYNDFGGACALSVMLLVLLGVFSAGYLRLTRSGEDG
ncbi:sugar ABC transporter permease [Streptomyces sp. NPDC048277]|uniref:carbohydrate ABC transporter permease n=1 Tax=Streptomyces sp. NPDC048277 TaxID=3155027 RepID=UPI0033EB5B8C